MYFIYEKKKTNFKSIDTQTYAIDTDKIIDGM